MLVTPLARIAVLLVLTAVVAALMVVRLTADADQATTVRPGTTVLVARHTPGSAAQGRHEYRLLLARAASASGR